MCMDVCISVHMYVFSILLFFFILFKHVSLTLDMQNIYAQVFQVLLIALAALEVATKAMSLAVGYISIYMNIFLV